MDIIVPRSFRQLVLRTYPALKRDGAEPYLRLLCRLMFSSRRCEFTGNVLVDYNVLASDAGKEAQAQCRNFKAEVFLRRFREDTGISIEWSNWNWNGRKCRSCKVNLSPEVEAALEGLKGDFSWLTGDVVYFVSGRRFSAQEQSVLLIDSRAKAKRHSCRPYKQAKDILDYLNAAPAKTFAPIAKRAKELLLNWNFDPDIQAMDPDSRENQARVLLSIASCAVPIYQPSRKGKTDRVFGVEQSMLNLKKALRHRVCEGWYEFDLKNAQLAIVGKLWRITEVQEFLRTGRSIWDDLLPFLGVNKDDSRWNDVKAVCKEVLYSIIFGMVMPAVRGKLTKELGALEVEFPLMFLDHPVIAAVVKRRYQIEQAMIAKGYVTTCFGKRIEVKIKKDAQSAMAQQAQALELKIIHAAYELAETTKEFRIVLHQHDGFSVKFRRRPELWIPRIVEAVENRAASLGVETSLDWIELKPAVPELQIA